MAMNRFLISQGTESACWAVHARPHDPPQLALAALDLPSYEGVIVMHGGAGGMDTDQISELRQFFTMAVAPFAERHRILIADGGTRAGAMAAMGDARRNIGGTYPLVGVCPQGTITYPGGPAPREGRYPLDTGHSHFIFVEGSEFGVESDLLVGLLKASGKPGFALVINGGEIVSREVSAHAAQGNLVVVVRGSGRVADELADPISEERTALPPGAQLEVVDLDEPQEMRALLERLVD